MNTWLLLDTNQLCHRAFHTKSGLYYDNTPTGAIYGVLADVISLQGKFNTNNIVFAFDFGLSRRRKLCPTYKMGRQKLREEMDEEQKKKYAALIQQIEALRTNWLKRIGFKNVFSKKGYEADDIIASICLNLKGRDEAIIVSSDKDLLQLLRPRVRIYNPAKKQVYTREIFKRDYGITPKMWYHVKALAGCNTDEIPGIRGVGEKTAIKFLNDELKEGTKTYQSIISPEGTSTYWRNLKAVKLPLKGTPTFKLRKDKTLEWGPAMKALGIRTLNPDVSYKERPKLA